MSQSKLELLAPAGQMKTLLSVVEAGADAVYLGGKRFNMRELKTDFNFADEEIAEAVEVLHRRNRKLYITVNSLYNEKEIDEIADYLLFLDKLGVDALIVQDLGIIDLCQEMQLKIPLHASVQMGIANLEAVKLLEAQGIERVILSKDLTLAEIKDIAADSCLGIEYFVHGDLCISHTGQCFMSSFSSGESGNRGRCHKPCRWPYQVEGAIGDELAGSHYLLAHNDLCLYPYLPQLIGAGVTSFKIEGRMRTPEYLAYLVGIYRRALDRFMADPASYLTDETEVADLEEHRIRDYTTGNFWSCLDRSGIGLNGDREPKIQTSAETLIPLSLSEVTAEDAINHSVVPELTVRVGGLEGLKSIADMGIDNIILGYDKIRQNRQNWNESALQQAFAILSGTATKIYLETPRIVSQKDLDAVRQTFKAAEASPTQGVVVNDLGSLKLFGSTGLDIWAGYGLNTFNSRAASFLQGLGVSRVTASLEMNREDLSMLLEAHMPTELMVQGPLPGMITDYCVIRASQSETESECAMFCLQDEYALVDACGQKYRIVTDENCRSYLLFPYELSLLPFLPRLSGLGVKSFRIDGQYYDSGKLGRVVAVYQQALEQLKVGRWAARDNWRKMTELFPQGLTGGLMTPKQ
ncbi:MAG: U32 family peptidase [Firmicutes bacterium]|nr:U32 family peptidase [Bacillota bacterium]